MTCVSVYHILPGNIVRTLSEYWPDWHSGASVEFSSLLSYFMTCVGEFIYHIQQKIYMQNTSMISVEEFSSAQKMINL